MSMNNVNNASHAERRRRIMRRNYGKRYRQTTKVILEVFVPWWITMPTTSRTEKRKSDRRSQTRPEHLWDSAYPKKSRNIQRKKTLKLRHEGGEQDKITNKKSSTTENVKKNPQPNLKHVTTVKTREEECEEHVQCQLYNRNPKNAPNLDSP